MPPIDHVVVLALENRSFDHMLGFLPHPNGLFDGLTEGGPYTNPAWGGGGAVVAATADAKPVLPVDPDHSHDAVMQQLRLRGWGPLRRPTNQGFVASYEDKGRGLRPPVFEGLLGPIANWWVRSGSRPRVVKGRGPLVMRCQRPDRVPVLSELALGFGVCSRWFASVPGETWPNRNFMHAATSDGTTDNEVRFYTDPTIFELLEEHGKRWHIYHDDTPQVWAFQKLWADPAHLRNWFPFSELGRHVEGGELPHYSFIEPNHRPPVHVPGHLPGDRSNSQHPGNNMVPDAAYDQYTGDGGDFERGEALIAAVYEALRSNPSVFERSVLVVTYDEHGGFFDHRPPPMGVPGPGDPPTRGRLGEILARLLHRKAEAFDFTMPGPRVPALVISPFVPAGTVSNTPRDHASIPATLRALFAPTAEPLTRRDAWAPPFHLLLSLEEPRPGSDLPDLSAHLSALADAGARAGEDPWPGEQGPEPAVPAYYRDFVALAEMVGRRLPGPAPLAPAGARATARDVTADFTRQADAARAGGPGDRADRR